MSYKVWICLEEECLLGLGKPCLIPSLVLWPLRGWMLHFFLAKDPVCRLQFVGPWSRLAGDHQEAWCILRLCSSGTIWSSNLELRLQALWRIFGYQKCQQLYTKEENFQFLCIAQETCDFIHDMPLDCSFGGARWWSEKAHAVQSNEIYVITNTKLHMGRLNSFTLVLLSKRFLFQDSTPAHQKPPWPGCCAKVHLQEDRTDSSGKVLSLTCFLAGLGVMMFSKPYTSGLLHDFFKVLYFRTSSEDGGKGLAATSVYPIGLGMEAMLWDSKNSFNICFNICWIFCWQQVGRLLSNHVQLGLHW